MYFRVGSLKDVLLMNTILKIYKIISICLELKNTNYIFSLHDIYLGIKLNVKGYREFPNEEVICMKNGMRYLKIGTSKIWVSENCFKPNELAYIYNEVFLSSNKNPHAYENDYVKINKDDYVIDAGACEGFFIRYALDRGSNVFAFEPLKLLFENLVLTYKNEIATNKLKIINKGLSDENKCIKFDTGTNYICESKINPSGTEECEVTSLDLLVESHVIPKVDFIKMDIEGAEISAVKGAKKTICKFKPKIAIAVYHEYEYANIIKSILLEYRPDYNVSFGGCYTFEKPYRPYMIYAW